MEEVITDRKSFLREKVLECVEKTQPELLRSFNMRGIVDLPGTAGMLRDLTKNFKLCDKRIFIEILSDLKREKILMHKCADSWVRLQ